MPDLNKRQKKGHKKTDQKGKTEKIIISLFVKCLSVFPFFQTWTGKLIFENVSTGNPTSIYSAITNIFSSFSAFKRSQRNIHMYYSHTNKTFCKFWVINSKVCLYVKNSTLSQLSINFFWEGKKYAEKYRQIRVVSVDIYSNKISVQWRWQNVRIVCWLVGLLLLAIMCGPTWTIASALGQRNGSCCV